MVEITLIAAVAKNRVIGSDGEIPWSIPADLAHFKQKTTGHPVIMGRKTYESIVDRLGHPLPARMNIVLTSTITEQNDHENVFFTDSKHDALSFAESTIAGSEFDFVTADDETVFIIGGETVYKQYHPKADRLVLTEIDQEYDGDTYFPDWKSGGWVEASREDHDGFAFVEYERGN